MYRQANERFRFENLGKDQENDEKDDENKDNDENIVGGFSLLENTNDRSLMDMVMPFSLVTKKSITNMIGGGGGWNRKRNRARSPTVIGGELFDAMFFNVGSQEKETRRGNEEKGKEEKESKKRKTRRNKTK